MAGLAGFEPATF